MRRGACSGGGHSSLGYMFGLDGRDMPSASHINGQQQPQLLLQPPPWDLHINVSSSAASSVNTTTTTTNNNKSNSDYMQMTTNTSSDLGLPPVGGAQSDGPPSEDHGHSTMLAAGRIASPGNNYPRGNQNTGNFITDRPTTKVHSPPGGISSLGYLFGGSSN